MLFTRKTSFNKVLATIGALTVGTALAAVTPEERASIGLEGTTLTPTGAIRAGNAEGTIPEWKNVPIVPPEGYKSGGFHLDPFADDAVRFTITSQNFQEHADKLSEGQKRMFETYSDFFMNIYPTRRSMIYQPYIYEAALKNLDRSELRITDFHMGMIGYYGTRKAWAFPIPHNGNEAFLNQASRPRPVWYDAAETTIAVASTGDYVVNKLQVNFHYKWSDPELSDDDPGANPQDNTTLYAQVLTAPAKLAGQVVLVHEPPSFSENFRKAWAYSPGQRRVKRAPQIVYDNPTTAGDGLGTTDQGYGFNGPNDRFTYKLLGKREMYVPYNPYKLAAEDATPDKVIKEDGRLNQDYSRYELHRVWVIEASLKEGTSHAYRKRVFYLDEDSWEVMLVDIYDLRGELWRHWEDHNIMYYEIGFSNRVAEISYDFNAHRMLALMIDKNSAPNFAWRAPDNYFTPAAVRRRGIR
ncbi:MAG: DUF1329 domain-containing protein [Gammaproteobacteria bacterium]|nr:MAG: DUF1329 domain-containing protein [Gammaproteobacteria bacterium]RLA50519.1 MAG: DUF1329 domain-containing protein [Gammaproteobacteria bacterium]